ncbi:MAG: flavodoxin [Spirochaetes bacterium DG_61]|jgi:flavorubredoxin|nr:MAG: flavodoxin [Spirochaetes bacterium DG_61]
MDNPIAITEQVHWIGANDLETELFESIWPLPQGVSYNTYIIDDEKVAVIDTLKRNFLPQFIDKILSVSKKVDYLIVNHMEPDHSGSMKVLHKIFPDMKIVGNKKTVDYIKGFYRIDEKDIEVIEDGETLNLGRHTLQFFLTPMVHWPETMMTYETSNKILFSGDAFGGFGTLNGGIFDDEVDLNYFENEILRYYSNIVAKYSPMVQKALGRLKDLDVKIIAATHGPIFRKNPAYIVNLYDRWSRQETERGVVLVYASMYGNTQKMAEAVARALAREGVDRIRLHNISKSHLSFVLTDIWRFRGLLLGSCTYNTKLFPPMDMLVRTLENDNLKNRAVGIFGSYSWSGGAVKDLRAFAESGNLQFTEPVVEVKHSPILEDYEQLRLLGKNIAKAL